MTDEIDAGVTRRRFGLTAGHALASLAVASACGATTNSTRPVAGVRLTARPRGGVKTSLTSGAIGLGSDGRDGVVQMPATIPDGQLAVLLYLHGATQSGTGMLRRVGPAADKAGVVLVAPDSRGTTWDAIRGNFGDDVLFLDRVLELVFAKVDVDPSRIAVGGFSDGASYALSLGLSNGDLFPRIVANSPGFVIPAPPSGKPRIFVSHGTSDPILPIDDCSRVIVPRLKAIGYDVTFREFDGRHEVPPAIATEAIAWITG